MPISGRQGNYIAVCNACRVATITDRATSQKPDLYVRLQRRGWNVSRDLRTVECPSCVTAIDRNH